MMYRNKAIIKLSESTSSRVSILPIGPMVGSRGVGGWGRLGVAHQHDAIQTKACWAPILVHRKFLLTAQAPVPRWGMLPE
jgi:hypothetical protein